MDFLPEYVNSATFFSVPLSICLSVTLYVPVCVSSRVGRVRILMFTSLCQFGLGVTVAFSGNYYFFMVVRFLLAMVSSVFLCVYFPVCIDGAIEATAKQLK